jgi:hypothetical protein
MARLALRGRADASDQAAASAWAQSAVTVKDQFIASPVVDALTMPQTLWPVATQASSTPGTAPMKEGRPR